jgi:hypothetical protein
VPQLTYSVCAPTTLPGRQIFELVFAARIRASLKTLACPVSVMSFKLDISAQTVSAVQLEHDVEDLAPGVSESPLLLLQPLELNNILSYCSVHDLNELGRTCR